MKLRRCQIIRYTAIIAVAFLAVSSIYPIKAFAVESITLPVQVMDDDVVSISIPATGESETSVLTLFSIRRDCFIKRMRSVMAAEESKKGYAALS